MSKRRIAARHIGTGHDRSIERGAEELERAIEHEEEERAERRRRRLLEASAGDRQHADRIAEVIRLPRPPLQQLGELYDHEEEELELDHAALGLAWLLAALLGLVAWAILAALAFGVYELAVAL